VPWCSRAYNEESVKQVKCSAMTNPRPKRHHFLPGDFCLYMRCTAFIIAYFFILPLFLMKKYGIAVSFALLSSIVAPIVLAAPYGIKPDDSSEKSSSALTSPAAELNTSWVKVAADKAVTVGKLTLTYKYFTKTFKQASCPDGYTLLNPNKDGEVIITSKASYHIPPVFADPVVLDSKSTGVQTYANPKYEQVKSYVKFDSMVLDMTNPAKHVWKARVFTKKAFVTTKQWTETDTPAEGKFGVLPANLAIISTDADWKLVEIPICEKVIAGGGAIGGDMGGIGAIGGGGQSSSASTFMSSASSSEEYILCESEEMCSPDEGSSSSTLSMSSTSIISSSSAMSFPSSVPMMSSSSFGFSSSSF